MVGNGAQGNTDESETPQKSKAASSQNEIGRWILAWRGKNHHKHSISTFM